MFNLAQSLDCFWCVASSQAKGTKATSFLTRKERVRNEVALVPWACEDRCVDDNERLRLQL